MSTLLELLDRTLEKCLISKDLAAEGALKQRLTANDWFKQSLFNVVIARTPDNRGNGACHCDCAERRALSRWPRLFTTRLHVVHRLSDREQPLDTICLLTLGTPLTLPSSGHSSRIDDTSRGCESVKGLCSNQLTALHFRLESFFILFTKCFQ